MGSHLDISRDNIPQFVKPFHLLLWVILWLVVTLISAYAEQARSVLKGRQFVFHISNFNTVQKGLQCVTQNVISWSNWMEVLVCLAMSETKWVSKRQEPFCQGISLTEIRLSSSSSHKRLPTEKCALRRSHWLSNLNQLKPRIPKTQQARGEEKPDT